MGAEVFDVVVVGAGISGIDAAHNLKTRCPDLSFVVLERRATFGGTWDLFRYPGIRSDSDMFTFGYDFRPWGKDKPIAPGADIREYLEGAVRDGGFANSVRYGRHVVRAEWSSQKARWLLECEDGEQYECWFLYACAGYYDYDRGWEPPFEGAETFERAGGRIVHPQRWPEGLDLAGRRVAVVGSGATAITLIPAIAQEAQHVTMVQRSPTYILPYPNYDPVAAAGVEENLPRAEIHHRVREHKASWMGNMVQTSMTVEQRNQMHIGFMRKALPPKYMSDEEFKKHFTPRYNVWEQRLCTAPDGDFFRAIRRKRASVVTDHIKCFDARGIQLESGDRVDADVIITATGLQLHANPPMATMQVSMDGEAYVSREHTIYKDCMLSEVPNFMFCRGYFSGSWTLKADLVCQYLCRLLSHMRATGAASVRPVVPPGGVGEVPEPTIGAGYFLRSADVFPRYGTERPWAPMLLFVEDRVWMEQSPIDDGHLSFAPPPAGAAAPPSPPAAAAAPAAASAAPAAGAALAALPAAAAAAPGRLRARL